MKVTRIAYTGSLLIVGLGLAVNGYSQSFLTNGLVAYYPFNGNANDASGNGVNGTNYGATLTTDRFAHPNSAYLFDGVSAFINCGNPPALTFTNPFTVSAWISPNVGGSRAQMIVSKENEYWFALRDGFLGCTYWTTSGGSPNWNEEWSQVFIPTGVWTEVAMVYGETNVTLFTNGTAIASLGVGPMPHSFDTTMAEFRIGDRQLVQAGDSEWFHGDIDDVRIYNRALSASEIQQLYVIESGPRVDLIKAVKPSFNNLTLTTNYQLQVSGDMRTWTNQGSAFTAVATNMIYPQYFDVANWNSLYFRLQVAP
jgi:hypothetical protein